MERNWNKEKRKKMDNCTYYEEWGRIFVYLLQQMHRTTEAMNDARRITAMTARTTISPVWKKRGLRWSTKEED